MSIATKGVRFSYVITFWSDREWRAANLYAVLRWLSQIGGMKVVLVEQDRTPQVMRDTLSKLASASSGRLKSSSAIPRLLNASA